jgi:hypothetical protein
MGTELPYVFSESGVGPRDRIKRPEIGDRIRTFFATSFDFHRAREGEAARPAPSAAAPLLD